MHAPQVSAPTQRAPSPARPVTQASPQHPAATRAKVRHHGRFAAAFAYSQRPFSYHQLHRSVTYYAKNTAFVMPVETLADFAESFTAAERATR